MPREWIAANFGRALRALRTNPISWLLRVLALGAVAAIATHNLRQVWSFTIDDAGISYAYAKHLAEGNGPVAVIGGPWIEGYSNALWVFLLIPFHWLGLSLPNVAKWLGVALFAVALLSARGFLLRAGRRQAQETPALLLALASFASVELVVWIVAGLENALLAALLFAVAACDTQEQDDPRSRGFSGLLAFGVSITRPEGLLYVAPLFALKCFDWLRRGRREQALNAALWFGAPFLVYHIVHYAVFREFVPNTYYAKPATRNMGAGLKYLAASFKGSILPYCIPFAAIGLWRPTRALLLVSWYCIAGTAFVIYSGGDWMPHGRFVSFFALPLLTLASVGVLRVGELTAALARGKLPASWPQLAVGGALVVASLVQQAPRFSAIRKQNWCHFCDKNADARALKALAEKARLPRTSLLTQDFGGPSWQSDDTFSAIDFLGLCDRSMALLRRDGKPQSNPALYQYAFHEQPALPSWVAIPTNFWKTFKTSTEARQDYFSLGRVLPKLPSNATLYFHRGEIYDYFPNIEAFSFAPLGERLQLLGAESSAPFAPASEAPQVVGPGSRVRFAVVVTFRDGHPEGETLRVRVQAGDRETSSPAVTLTRGIPGIDAQVRPGEPIAAEFELELPKGTVPKYDVQLSMQRRGGPAVDVPLLKLTTGAALPPPKRELPRYPTALPAPTAEELKARRAAVTRAIERWRRALPPTEHERQLAEELAGLGRHYETQGAQTQAYLAYVWSTQVDARKWRDLSDPILRVRKTSVDEQHVLELVLLRRYYATGSARALSELIGFYQLNSRELEARYFAERGARAASGAAPLAAVASDPLKGAFDFEARKTRGWSGDDKLLVSGPTKLLGLRAYHGKGVLTTRGARVNRGAALSPEFTLDGSTLSLLLGGDSRSAGVELLVDGQIIERAQGNGSNSLEPVLWDISAHAQRRAQLRVFDTGSKSFAILDRVLLWR